MMYFRQFDKAWKHLAEANRLQHSTVSYSKDNDNVLFQVHCFAYGQDLLCNTHDNT